ncbi:MAG: Asp-tRNA(Asn)/Glu-tRNA(Gln) amidotransferase subunit GatC [Planctomycetaceae bacterium]|jgi:aspartyl-tRNA(Asn)/glutamyl-tRNA(Gln) amidotransferase subunit C|nr:Asp-tRNA(Asn)/Glu-tRNA(Gln) amidotransferase subunit GatC [Planctomycetaceae bacterium]
MIKTIKQEEILKISMLARLHPTPEEAERAAQDLQQVLNYAELLNEVDTQDVEPMTRVIDETNCFRDDANVPSASRDSILSIAPKTDGECFLVPPVLE